MATTRKKAPVKAKVSGAPMARIARAGGRMAGAIEDVALRALGTAAGKAEELFAATSRNIDDVQARRRRKK
ncbi:MAG: hypothetical protein HY690_16375 [Chloroflexi bacterium]|nr:hypothetical protein [Chloroflexota bacterium]